MKRLHVHVSVDDLASAIEFYAALFAAPPTFAKPDYAKWMLDDPRVNFAVSSKPGVARGLSHLGVQAETDAEFGEIHARLEAARIANLHEPAARCCYAESEKHWAVDPAGVVWEMFHTTGAHATYGESAPASPSALAEAAAATGRPAPGGCC